MSDQEKTAFDPEELLDRQLTLPIRCLAVGAFYLSFVASLLALLLNGITPAYIPSWFPVWLRQGVENNRIILLLIPLFCLFACYWMLRYMTGDILARPERYLDERQKMLRDQVHRSAYKVLKGACLIVPVALLLFTIFWPTSAPLPRHIHPNPDFMTTITYINTDKSSLLGTFNVIVSSPAGVQTTQIIAAPRLASWQRSPTVLMDAQPTSWLQRPENIGLFFGAFLLCLFLTISALPMTLLACKEKD